MPPRELTPTGPWAPLRRYRGQLAAGALFLVATTALSMAIPKVMQVAIDTLRQGETGVGRYALWMVGLAAGAAAVRIGSRLFIFNAGRNAETDLRNHMFGHLLELSPSFYRQHPTGDVMSRLTSDVTTLRLLWGPGLLNVVNTAMVFATALTLMGLISVKLTLAALVTYPALFFLGRWFGRDMYRHSVEAQRQTGVVTSAVQEDLAGVHVSKLYGLGASRRKLLAARTDELLDTNLSLARARGRLMPVFAVTGAVGITIGLWLGGTMVAEGRMTLGELVAFQAYLAQLLWPTLALGWILSLFQRGKGAWSRVKELLDAPVTMRGGAREFDAAGARGHLRVEGLTIEYGDTRVLDSVSLDVPAGSTCAIVGRTGSGKSTLVEAMVRLLEVPPGTVFLDDQDVTELPLSSVRQAIGYAPQDSFLFTMSLADNIAFARREEDGTGRHRIAGSAATSAGLGTDLASFPQGLATLVGERGITLSGGQRQRAALARAIASDPLVLVLDDSLSSVDTETERRILEELGNKSRVATTILISHRVAAVSTADQILVMDQGRVAERGRHVELISRGGIYAELYREQLTDVAIAEGGEVA